MNAIWQCGVCETVNNGGRSCSACGADVSRRSTVAATVRTRLTPAIPPPPVPRPLPEPVRRAINREPVPEEEWVEYEVENGYEITPIPGGCLVSMGPKRRW